MVNLSAVNMTEVAVLRAKLKEKEIEVDSLNAVLQKQGKSLQQFQGSSVDDAKKRQDALLRAHVARSDKLEAEKFEDERKAEKEETKKKQDEEIEGLKKELEEMKKTENTALNEKLEEMKKKETQWVKDGGRNRENPPGKDFGDLKGYLEGICGNPSLAKTQGKTSRKPRQARKTKKTYVSLCCHYVFFVSAPAHFALRSRVVETSCTATA